MKDVQVGGGEIAEGQLGDFEAGFRRNFDPAKFEQPEVLDVGRMTAGQLGLGTGMHACVGAVLVRMACAVVTPMFLKVGPVRAGDVRWTSDKTLLWPVSVPVGFTEL